MKLWMLIFSVAGCFYVGAMNTSEEEEEYNGFILLHDEKQGAAYGYTKETIFGEVVPTPINVWRETMKRGIIHTPEKAADKEKTDQKVDEIDPNIRLPYSTSMPIAIPAPRVWENTKKE